MTRFLENQALRRTITVPGVYLGLLSLSVLMPLLLVIFAAVDVLRRLIHRRPAMALRITLFAWVYLLGEAWALLALGYAGLFAREASLRLTYRFQRTWLDWNFNSIRLVFGLNFSVEGDSNISPSPFLLLSRHASLIDTMLPGRFVVRPHGIKLRYVLKKELLMDPALDIGGNRLPNYFIDRAGDTGVELRSIALLGTGMEEDEAVLIYPEGTRYSEEKRVRYTRQLAGLPGRAGEIAARYTQVLPPRPGGTLELLEATDCDIVVLAHRGLEGFARVRDIWSGDLIDTTIDIRFWRILRNEIPESREQRIEWLFDIWEEVDQWVAGKPQS